MTFPLTTGPGTIAASIALSAQIPTRPILSYLVGAFALAGGCGPGVAGALLPVQERRFGAAPARRDRHARDDAADGLHPALHRHPDHVDRLG